MPEFRCDIGFVEGARQTFADTKRRGAWRRHEGDAEYSALVERARALGFEEVSA